MRTRFSMLLVAGLFGCSSSSSEPAAIGADAAVGIAQPSADASAPTVTSDATTGPDAAAGDAGSDTAPVADGGAPDTSPLVDAGVGDAGHVDAAATDAGAQDDTNAPAVDAAVPDAAPACSGGVPGATYPGYCATYPGLCNATAFCEARATSVCPACAPYEFGCTAVPGTLVTYPFGWTLGPNVPWAPFDGGACSQSPTCVVDEQIQGCGGTPHFSTGYSCTPLDGGAAAAYLPGNSCVHAPYGDVPGSERYCCSH